MSRIHGALAVPRQGLIFKGKFHDPRVRSREVEPVRALLPYVESLWEMTWDLGTESLPSWVVPSGTVNLVFESYPQWHGKLVGVRRTAHPILLRGKGTLMGARFRPGACSLVTHPALDRALPLNELGEDWKAYGESVLARARFETLLEKTNDFLATKFPAIVPPLYAQIASIIETMEADVEISEVEQVAERAGLSERTLRRHFEQHVGIGPKMWLRTRRFQYAIHHMLTEESVDWADLSLRLGYFDQAHFNNDFKEMTGLNPGEVRW